MKNSPIKSYELSLPYYKQGDDLRDALDRNKNDIRAAFLDHAESLEAAAQMLRRMAGFASEHKMEVHADCHYIGIECTEEVGNLLMEEMLVEPSYFEDEEFDEFEDPDPIL